MFKRIHKFEANTEIEIRVYQGAVSYGHQWIPFHQACNIISSTSNIRIVSLNCSEVNKNQLSEMDIINWLLGGDIHFIISHIHQGIVNIKMNKLYIKWGEPAFCFLGALPKSKGSIRKK